MVEKVLFTIVGLIIVLFIAIIIKYFVSNNKASRVFSQKIVTKENKNYLIKADYGSQILSFTCRGINEDGKPGLITKTYKFDEFIESLTIDQQIYFHEFLFKHCMEDNVKAKVTINCNKIFHEKDQYWLRLNFMERQANNVVYMKGVKIFKRNNLKEKNNFEYLSISSFKNKIKNMYPKIDGPIGTLFCFSFNSMEFFQKRYGIETANDYLMAIWDEINSLFINRGFVGHLKGDTFLAYYDKKINKREIQYFLHSIINTTDFTFEMDGQIRTIKPLIGVIVVGEFTTNLEKNFDCIYQAMIKLKESNTNSRYRIYDDSLYTELKREEEYFNSLKATIDNQLFDPLYSPIISLNSGQTYGFFTDLDFSNYNFRSFNDILNKTNTNELGTDFFSKALSKWFSSFLNNANMDVQKLFVFTNFELIDSLINTYTSNEDYDKINLVAIITNYSDILEDPEVTRQKIESLKRNGIGLGIIASKDLQTVLSQELHKFQYLVLPRELTKDIITNPRNNLVLSTILDITKPYYMDKIAVDIDNYQEAEFLKDMDIFYMSGNLFDAKKSTISMRKLAHLYDEYN